MQPRGYNVSSEIRTSPDHVPYEVINGSIHINTNSGHHVHIRRTIQKWLYLSTGNSSVLTGLIRSSSASYRRTLLRWITESIPAKLLDDSVIKLTTEIRDSLGIRGEFPRSIKDNTISDFIRIVHSHESIEYAKIRGILHDSSLFPLLHTDQPPSICDKQIPPIAFSLCNFTRTSLNLSNLDINDSPCLCTHILKLHTPNDLVNGHIMTCNYDTIPHLGVKHLFQYGTKFRINLSERSIMEAIDLGLQEYVD